MYRRNNRMNITPVYFEFTLFEDFGHLKYLFFLLCLFVYITIISANMVIVVTIVLEKSLHQPMYIFICCLSLNSVYGSTGFFPRLLFDLLSDSHFISRPSCFTQIFVIYTFISCEFTMLGVMAYDRFVAICQPLYYQSKMTSKRVVCLWAAAVVCPVITIGLCMIPIIQLSLCGYKIHRIVCGLRAIVNISCDGSTKSDIFGFIVFVTTVFIPLFVVFYSYVRILLVCRKGSAEVKGKALQTCIPHLATFVTYTCSVCIDFLLIRLFSNRFSPTVTAVLSVECQTLSSINNPLIYGLKLPRIREAVLRRFQNKMKVTVKTGLEM